MKKDGFTLIELLMVVAIVGLLAAILVASLTDSRAKGADGAIKKQMTQVRAQAELFYINNSNIYTNLCSSGTYNISSMVSELTTISGVAAICNSSATQYAVSVKMKQPSSPTTYLCIDSTNIRKTTTTALGSATVCP